MRPDPGGAEPKPSSEPTGAAVRPPAAGISQFLGRVLEQLNLSSWLPAAMLVGNGALLLQIHRLGRPDLLAALKRLTGKPLGTLTVLLFALLLAAMVTQAFEFEVIRLLEGYLDTSHRAVQMLVALRIRRHAHKRTKLASRYRRAEQTAFAQARLAMLGPPQLYPSELVQVLDDEIFERPRQPHVTEQQVASAHDIDWEQHATSEAMYLVAALDARLRGYPQPHRLMPTRLGNTLRAGEDTLSLAPEENLESYVIRHHDRLPQALRDEHRDYRTRLDMYCCLVLVFWALAVASVAVLGPLASWWATGLVVTGYAFMAIVSYEAAIASARGYVEALQEISRFVVREREAEEQADMSSARARLRAWFHRHPV